MTARQRIQIAALLAAWSAIAAGAALIYPPAGLIAFGLLILVDLYRRSTP